MEISFNDEMMFQAASNTCQRSTGRRARQALAINEKASLWSVSDTCRCMIGRHARGIATSSFVFNEEASLQAANATRRHATGRCFRDVVSSDFWRFFECGRVLWGFSTEFKGLLSCFTKRKFSCERLSFSSS